jgi:hypothetical protein
MRLSECRRQRDFDALISSGKAVWDECDFGIEHFPFPLNAEPLSIVGGEKIGTTLNDPSENDVEECVKQLRDKKLSQIAMAKGKCHYPIVYAENWPITFTYLLTTHQLKVSYRGGIVKKDDAIIATYKFNKLQQEINGNP